MIILFIFFFFFCLFYGSILTVISTFENAVNVINEVLPNLENSAVSISEGVVEGRKRDVGNEFVTSTFVLYRRSS